jgi:hypothetical protein
MQTEKKVAVPVEESLEVSAGESVEYVEAQGWDASATKRLLRRLDWHILPIMSLIYL